MILTDKCLGYLFAFSITFMIDWIMIQLGRISKVILSSERLYMSNLMTHYFIFFLIFNQFIWNLTLRLLCYFKVKYIWVDFVQNRLIFPSPTKKLSCLNKTSTCYFLFMSFVLSNMNYINMKDILAIYRSIRSQVNTF